MGGAEVGGLRGEEEEGLSGCVSMNERDAVNGAESVNGSRVGWGWVVGGKWVGGAQQCAAAAGAVHPTLSNTYYVLVCLGNTSIGISYGTEDASDIFHRFTFIENTFAKIMCTFKWHKIKRFRLIVRTEVTSPMRMRNLSADVTMIVRTDVTTTMRRFLNVFLNSHQVHEGVHLVTN